MESRHGKARSYKKTRASPIKLAAQAPGPSGEEGQTTGTKAKINTVRAGGQKETMWLKPKAQMGSEPGDQVAGCRVRGGGGGVGWEGRREQAGWSQRRPTSVCCVSWLSLSIILSLICTWKSNHSITLNSWSFGSFLTPSLSQDL